MKQYRAPVSRLDKERLEWVINRRKEAKLENPFGMAHFPAGTIAVFESPCERFLGDDEPRKYYGQRYSTFEAEVLGVVSNGADSWVAILNRPCKLIEGRRDSINVNWAREIIKRGNGPLHCNDHDAKYDPLTERSFHPWDRETQRQVNKHHSHYYIDSVRSFIIGQIIKNDGGAYGTHLIDTEKLVGMMANDLMLQATKRCTDDLWGLVISKKKFHKLLNRHLPRARINRKEEAYRQRKIDEEQCMRDMEMEDRLDRAWAMGDDEDPVDEDNFTMEDSYFDSPLTDMYEDSARANGGDPDADWDLAPNFQSEEPKQEKIQTIGDLLRAAMESDDRPPVTLVDAPPSTLEDYKDFLPQDKE